MNLTVQEGDALAMLQAGRITALGHQVNLLGLMGAGIAAQVRKEFPVAYRTYREAITAGRLRLGDILPVEVQPGRWIVHLAGQQTAGLGRHTNYAALVLTLGHFKDFADEHGLIAGLPYGIGCGLGGGDWKTVATMIETTIPAVTLVRLPADEMRWGL